MSPATRLKSNGRIFAWKLPQRRKKNSKETTVERPIIDTSEAKNFSEDGSEAPSEMSLDGANGGNVKGPHRAQQPKNRRIKCTASSRNGARELNAKLNGGFRQSNATYQSKGTVVDRTSRKSNVKIKISYEPAPEHEGPQGFLHLPQSSKIRIYRLHTTKLRKIETTTCKLEEQAEDIPCEDEDCDLDPIPTLSNIEPSFAVHVVAIFRAISTRLRDSKT